jgi:hypothetical protein
MAYLDYTRNIDTLFAVASDTISGDPINLINAAGEKLLPELAAKGRIFMVNDAKQVSHPVMTGDGGGAIVDYLPGVITGLTAGHAQDNVAAEILTHAKFDMIASSRNISFPQDMPAGNQLDYMMNLLKSSGMGIFQREESLLLTGDTDGGASVASNSPMDGDTNFDATAAGRRPMSVLGIVAGGTEAGGTAALIDESGETFAGLEIDESPHWAPQRIVNSAVASGAEAESSSGAELEASLQKAILQCTFSGIESPDTVLIGTLGYEELLSGFRGRMAPQHLIENSGSADEFFMFGGLKVIRHRMLDYTDIKYDLIEGDTATYPVYLLNLKSLRMNIVKQDQTIGEGFGFLSSPIEGVYPHPEKTNLFKRVGWKRCYSLDNGRRSFGYIDQISAWG